MHNNIAGDNKVTMGCLLNKNFVRQNANIPLVNLKFEHNQPQIFNTI